MVQKFDRGSPAENRVLAAPNGSHAAFAEAVDQRVVTNSAARACHTRKGGDGSRNPQRVIAGAASERTEWRRYLHTGAQMLVNPHLCETQVARD